MRTDFVCVAVSSGLWIFLKSLTFLPQQSGSFIILKVRKSLGWKLRARRLWLSLTHTVVAEAAVGGTWRPEDLAGEAVLQLDCLAVDDHLLGPGRGPVAGAAVGHVWRWRREKRDASAIRGEEALQRTSRMPVSPPHRLQCTRHWWCWRINKTAQIKSWK